MEEALSRADFPTIDKIDPALRTSLVGWVNEGLAELHDLLVAADTTADYYKKTKTYSIVAGTEEYVLPSDFYKLKKVYYLTGATRRYRVERFDFNNINGYKVGPLDAGTVELWYVPAFAPLKRDIDIVDQVIPPTWENVASLTAAAHLLQKEQSDTSIVENDKRNLIARIMAMAEPRDEGEVDSISDVEGRGGQISSTAWAYEDRYKYRLLGNKISFIDAQILDI